MNTSSRLIFYNLFLSIGIFVISGCSPLIVPTPYHVPAVQNKSDLHLNALTGISEFNLQAAYMPVNKFVITSSYSTNIAAHKTDGFIHHQTSLGAGYIYKRRKTQWAITGGYGWGKSRDNDTDVSDQIKYYNTTSINYSSIYIQPYLNVLVSRGFNFYAGLRTTLLLTNNFYTNDDEYRINPGNTGTFEPFIGLRAGYRKLMINLQCGIYSHADTYKSVFLRSDNVLNTHIGIGYTFGLSKKD